MSRQCREQPSRAAKLFSKDEARRIAVNIAKLPVLKSKKYAQSSSLVRSILIARRPKRRSRSFSTAHNARMPSPPSLVRSTIVNVAIPHYSRTAIRADACVIPMWWPSYTVPQAFGCR
jgi:hypothetical protein